MKRTTKRAKPRVNEANPIFKTFKRIAELLGEVEGGLSALYAVCAKAGLMEKPEGEVKMMSQVEAERVLAEAKAITTLLSDEATSLIPVIFLAVGDETANRVFVDSESKTIH